jgi:LmeA-like phospholipid-binding
MQDKPGLGEQALDKAVEIGISSQLDEVENLDINIKTDPLKLVQGGVDDVKIAGNGLVMQKDLRVTQLDMHMTSVAINPLSAALGKIELTRPTDASVRAVLTESDINRAFNSDYVRSKLQNLPVKVNGQSTTISAQQVDCRLPGDRQVAINAVVSLPDQRTEQVAFSATPVVSADGQTVALENIAYGQEELSPELTAALIEQTSEILNLSNFDLAGMSLKIKNLQIVTGKLTIQAEAHLEKIPTA